MEKYLTRRGNGRRIEMTADELKQDFELGTQDAAERGEILPLDPEDMERLFEIFTNPNRIVGVEPGNEVFLTDDASTLRLTIDQGTSGVGIPLGRMLSNMVHEKAFANDSIHMGHVDCSYKAVKAIVANEQQDIEHLLFNTISPVFYISMANLGMYYRPDGPYGNPSDLLPAGKIKEALSAQEEAVEHAIRDMTYIGQKLDEIGCDGINLDTIGAAGDTDFKATLHVVENLKKTTKLSIEVGMAGEFILGMHGGLAYDGKRLAGMYPNQQVEVLEKAGADIYGPVINTKPTKSSAFNVARAVTFAKSCSEKTKIPMHPNVGMGVGGIPVFETPPIDIVTRASKALVEIGKADGL
jgi:dimethylamine--corrinoid protein Co-methyltransferase